MAIGRFIVRALTIAVLAAGLSACASAPPDTFEISSPRASGAGGSTRAQILIPEPAAIQTLDSQNIVVKPTPYTVEYLGASQWGDRLPRMVQLRMLQRFENTGRIGAVGLPGQDLAIDYQLIMEIRRFEISVVDGRRAIVEISVKALNDRTGVVRRTQVFSAEVPVQGASNNALVAALDSAFDSVADEIVAWTLQIV